MRKLIFAIATGGTALFVAGPCLASGLETQQVITNDAYQGNKYINTLSLNMITSGCSYGHGTLITANDDIFSRLIICTPGLSCSSGAEVEKAIGQQTLTFNKSDFAGLIGQNISLIGINYRWAGGQYGDGPEINCGAGDHYGVSGAANGVPWLFTLINQPGPSQPIYLSTTSTKSLFTSIPWQAFVMVGGGLIVASVFFWGFRALSNSLISLLG